MHIAFCREQKERRPSTVLLTALRDVLASCRRHDAAQRHTSHFGRAAAAF